MKIRITRNHVDALCVLIGVLGMGSLYFQVLRMPLMAAMLIASILLLTRAHHPKISAQNVRLTQVFWVGAVGIGFLIPLALSFFGSKAFRTGATAFYTSGLAAICGMMCLRLPADLGQ